MFVLTPREQRFVVFAILTLVIGASIQHCRERKLEEKPINRAESQATITPSPND